MYVFYSERSQSSKIFCAKLLKEYTSMRAINIDTHPDIVKKYNLKKVPTVLKGDGTKLEGDQCKTLFQKKKYLKYNQIENTGVGINNHKHIPTPTNQLDVSRDYNYSLLPEKGLLGQYLNAEDPKAITDNSYAEKIMNYRDQFKQDRSTVDNELGETSYTDKSFTPNKIYRDYTSRF